MRVALAYDRVNKWGGAERTLLALHELFPKAPLYTAVYHPEKAPWAKKFPKVIPSFLNKISFLRDKHELLGAFTPIAFETFDFSEYDLVISVTSEAAKGIITKPQTIHICYCLTPTRYLWSLYSFYFENPPSMFSYVPLFKYISRPIISYLKLWDKIASQRPDVIIGISTAVCERIKNYYGRNSELVYPPVDFRKFRSSNPELITNIKDYYLVVSRLIPYKRPDLVVDAFNEINLPLIIVGTGSEEGKLRKRAKKNIRFVGQVSDEELIGYYSNAKALIFPQDEDFGIVPLEAQSLGTPVVAYKKGGALDTVVEGKTGVFFNEQTKESLIKAINKIENKSFKKSELVENAKRFSKEKFKRNFLETVAKIITK